MTLTTRSTSAPSSPKLSEAARELVIPEGIKTSTFPRVYARLKKVGIAFDPWQQGFGMVALGCLASGKYAATIGGVSASIPRQVGKTYTVGHLLIGIALEFPNTRIVWTSHHNRTTTNTFRSMQGMVRKKAIVKFLAPNGIRTANGEQEIRFANGSIIMFGAREHGFGRGVDAIDFLVFDEAQILSLKALEDMVPAANQARHPHGALVFFIGTPPRPTDDGEAFTAKRNQALSGEGTDMFYVEIGADPAAESDDRNVWPLMNPSYPHRTPLEAMLRMRANIPDEDSWRREAMGIWDSLKSKYVIDPITWSERADEHSVIDSQLALGIDVSPDRSLAAVAVAGQREDGDWHIELDEQRNGVGWLAGYVADRCEKNDIRAVVIDRLSPAFSLVDELKQKGIKVTVTDASGMKAACGIFYDGANEGWLRHIDQPQLNVALSVARKRELQDAWAWSRKLSASDITPLVAATLALWGAKNSSVKRPVRRGGGRRVVSG